MGRAKKEKIDGVVINRYDGNESASVVGGASTVTTAPGNPKDILVSAGSGTPSTPSEEVSSEDLTGGSDTGSGSETGETGSGETGSSEPSKTYGDYVTEGYDEQKGIINSNYQSYERFWNGYLDNAESFNAKEREAAEQRAETERQRGVIDGQASYDFNKATYGKQAEALRSMGLSGSGYADYLTSRAYATQRAEVQGANAQAATAKREAREAEMRANATAKETANKGIFDAKVARDSALMDAKTTYLEGMLKFEENKDITYKTLIEAAASGTYSPEVLTRMAKEAGLDDTQIAEITNTYETSKSEKDIKANQEAYETVLKLAKSGKYSDEELRSIGEGRGLTPEQITSVINSSHSAKEESKASQGTAEFDVLLGYAKSGDYTIDELNALMKNTNLTYDQRESIISAATDVAKAGKSAVQEENYQVFYALLGTDQFDISEVNRAHVSGRISGTQLKQLKEKYNDVFSATFLREDGSEMSRSDALEELEDIKSNKWLSKENKDAAQAAFDKKYSAATYSGLELASGERNENDGRNIIFEMNDGGEIKRYKVEYDGQISKSDNPDIYSAAADISNKTIFAYNGKLYYKTNEGNIHKLAGVPGESSSGYNRICKLFGITG